MSRSERDFGRFQQVSHTCGQRLWISISFATPSITFKYS
jgi:hypothetical protein